MNARVGGLGQVGLVLGAADEDGELRAPCTGDEPLVAVDDPLVAVLDRRSCGSASGPSRRPRARSWRSRTGRSPSHSGRRYCSFWSSVAQCSSVCMLPSSGACAFRANGPMRLRAASADTLAIATWPRPMPPHSFGMCGQPETPLLGRLAHVDDAVDPLVAIPGVGLGLLLDGAHDRGDEVADLERAARRARAGS